MYIFPVVSRQSIWQKRVLFKLLARIEQEMWINFGQLNIRTDEIKINEQIKSIATGPIYVYTEFEAIRTSYLKM